MRWGHRWRIWTIVCKLSCYDGRKSFYTAHRDTPTFEGASTSIFTLGLKGWLQVCAATRARRFLSSRSKTEHDSADGIDSEMIVSHGFSCQGSTLPQASCDRSIVLKRERLGR